LTGGHPPGAAAHPLTLRFSDQVFSAIGTTRVNPRLGISETTVRTHLENIYERLHVSSHTAAVTRAFPNRAA
jgi:Bacterial regulatory proteins, luxR family